VVRGLEFILAAGLCFSLRLISVKSAFPLFSPESSASFLLPAFGMDLTFANMQHFVLPPASPFPKSQRDGSKIARSF
jgi:hypothetical protein